MSIIISRPRQTGRSKNRDRQHFKCQSKECEKKAERKCVGCKKHFCISCSVICPQCKKAFCLGCERMHAHENPDNYV
ncbi:MAG: hypothetical protein INQ03_17095 [Candidatus Heimdallarchaeota archaeon]|nr:hypothetical protein [Candidatus Heimdallarchaeota archaeon]